MAGTASSEHNPIFSVFSTFFYQFTITLKRLPRGNELEGRIPLFFIFVDNKRHTSILDCKRHHLGTGFFIFHKGRGKVLLTFSRLTAAMDWGCRSVFAVDLAPFSPATPKGLEPLKGLLRKSWLQGGDGKKEEGEESNSMKMGRNGYDFLVLERGYNYSAFLSFVLVSFLSHLLMTSRAKACMKSEFGVKDFGQRKLGLLLQ